MPVLGAGGLASQPAGIPQSGSGFGTAGHGWLAGKLASRRVLLHAPAPAQDGQRGACGPGSQFPRFFSTRTLAASLARSHTHILHIHHGTVACHGISHRKHGTRRAVPWPPAPRRAPRTGLLGQLVLCRIVLSRSLTECTRPATAADNGETGRDDTGTARDRDNVMARWRERDSSTAAATSGAARGQGYIQVGERASPFRRPGRTMHHARTHAAHKPTSPYARIGHTQDCGAPTSSVRRSHVPRPTSHRSDPTAQMTRMNMNMNSSTCVCKRWCSGVVSLRAPRSAR